MKAVYYEAFGGVDQLKVGEVATPDPADNEVQIEVAFTSVNPVDWKIREGYLKEVFDCEFPLIPGWDVSGRVSAIGSKVENFKEGDSVYAYCRKPLVKWGTYAEYVCMEAEHVAPKPKSLSFAQAAAIPLVTLTAWQALFDYAKITDGQSVLIHAGAGGVGSMAIQLAKDAGATVYTTASAGNHEYVAELGANVAIDYISEDFVAKMRELEPEGVDVVFDCAGPDALDRSYDLLKKDGYLLTITSPMDKERVDSLGIQGACIMVRPNGIQLASISQLLDEGTLQAPEVHAHRLFDDYAEATKASQEGHVRGKLVLQVK